MAKVEYTFYMHTGNTVKVVRETEKGVSTEQVMQSVKLSTTMFENGNLSSFKFDGGTNDGEVVIFIDLTRVEAVTARVLIF